MKAEVAKKRMVVMMTKLLINNVKLEHANLMPLK